MANTQLQKTFSGASNRKTFTLSFWIKRAKITSGMYIAHVGNQESNPQAGIEFASNDTFTFWNGGSGGGGSSFTHTTNRKFRDTSAWYHFVIAVDTTQATEANRLKIYVNGVQETGFGTGTYPAQNDDLEWNSTQRHTIGAYYNNQSYFDGLITHWHFVDGTAYTPSTFGETDSTSGIWKPKTAPSVTYGTNGFFLKFENSGAMGTDSSGNSNTFTTLGTLTQATDTPSNNFTALNPLLSGTGTGNAAAITTAGNTRADVGNNVWRTLTSSIAVSSGKWYFEGFGTSQASAYQHYGITSLAKFAADATMPDKEINEEQNGYAYGYYGNNGQIYYSTPSARSNGAYGSSYGASDYVGIFVDLDNNKLYVAKNGTLANSGTGYDISADGKPYFLAMSIYGANAQINFGQGVFGYSGTSYAKLTGTTYADANGHGVFKYSPNQGGASNFDSAAKNFYALNTENLKEFG